MRQIYKRSPGQRVQAREYPNPIGTVVRPPEGHEKDPVIWVRWDEDRSTVVPVQGYSLADAP